MPDQPQTVLPTGKNIYCLDCHYPLIGLDKNRCPECGRIFNPDDEESYSVIGPPRPLGVLDYILLTAGVLIVLGSCMSACLLPDKVINDIVALPFDRLMGGNLMAVIILVPLVFWGPICIYFVFQLIRLKPCLHGLWIYVSVVVVFFLIGGFMPFGWGLRGRMLLLMPCFAATALIELIWRRLHREYYLCVAGLLFTILLFWLWHSSFELAMMM